MAIHIRRREFIGLLGGATGWPFAARAQQSKLPVVGFLHAGGERTRAVASFQKGLAEAGYIADRNVAFELRWADGQFDRLPGLAADLVSRNVTVIAAFGNAAARAAKAATTTIPIAFASSSDPVAVGLVSSLTRPGWNVTGVSILNQELESTRLERLVQVVPHATTIAFLVNPESVTADPKLREMENAGRMFNRRLQVFNARSESEFEQVFLTVEQQRIAAMVVTSDTMFSNGSAALGRAAARHTVPTMGAYRDFARARVDELRQRPRRCLSPRRNLRSTPAQGRSAARSASDAVHQGRVRRQCGSLKGARPRHPIHAARARRRGNRISAILLRCMSPRLLSHMPSGAAW